MKKYLVSNFFDLSFFQHRACFENKQFPWQVIENLKDFILNQKLNQIHSKISNKCYLVNEDLIYLGKDVTVEDGAYIKGPCIILDGSTIRHGAYLRGGVLIGSNSIIGHATEVKNSIILNNAQAAHFAYVGDSIVGGGVNLGAGVKCANFRLDKKEITIKDAAFKIKTHLKKFGAIIGDHTQIGCNTTINPATFIGKSSICYSSMTIDGYIPENSIVKMLLKAAIRKRKMATNYEN